MLYYLYYMHKGMNAMKVGIVGNYGNDNNGDEAILLSIIQQVKQTFSIESSDITVFSNNPQQTAKRYGVVSYPLYYKVSRAVLTFGKTFHRNKDRVAQLDLLVIGGGGILMDLYKREAPLYGSYSMMALLSETPYIVYGCGAGPLNTSLGKWFIRYMAKHAQSISVRDPKSQELLKKTGVKRDVLLIGDPAFSLRKPKQKQPRTPKKIGVTAVPYYNAAYWPEGNDQAYQTYVNGMAKNLDAILDKEEMEVHFFATKFPQDADVTKDIAKQMRHGDKVVINDKNLPPQDILQVVRDMDIVIGTRLHSLILATDTETPIIAVSYHNKVNDFMQMAGLEDYVVSMEEVAADDQHFITRVQQMKENWSETTAQTEAVSKRFYESAMKGTEQFTSAVKK